MECWNGSGYWTKPGKVLVPGTSGRGYQKVYLAGGRQRYVHVLVLEAFRGPRPAGGVTLHANDDPADNRLENLSWGTPQENMDGAVERKRFPKQRQTSCMYGHVLEEPNLVEGHAYRERGHRQCKACNRARGYHRIRPELDYQSLSDGYYKKIMEGTD